MPKPAPSTVTPEPKCTNLTASLRPPATLPAPGGAMPPGSYAAQIRRRGYLLAGVNAGLLDFGYLNPASGHIEGFEIDLVRELTRAIFGDASPAHYRLVALTVPQRIPFVQAGRVDVVVDAVTITCARRKEVDFSTVYYEAHQRVLVPKSSPDASMTSLAGKRVCASAGSTPIEVMQRLSAPPRTVGAPQAIDCLVWSAGGQDRRDLHRRLDPARLHDPGPEHQDRRRQPRRRPLRDGDQQGASGLRPLRQRRPRQAARRRDLAPALRPVAQPPRLEPDPPRPASTRAEMSPKTATQNWTACARPASESPPTCSSSRSTRAASCSRRAR